MAAAYAALRSLEQTIAQIQNHPRPPISLDKTKTKSLTDIIIFLLHFLENYSFLDSREADALEARMADAAYAAEDLIESHVANHIEALSEILNYSFNQLHRSLQKVVEAQILINMELMKTAGGVGVGGSLRGYPSSLRLNNKIQARAEKLNSIVGLLNKALEAKDLVESHIIKPIQYLSENLNSNVDLLNKALEAEDLIESHIVNQIQDLSENLNSNVGLLYESLRKVTEVIEVVKTTGGDGVGDSLRGSPSSLRLNNKIQALSENLNSNVDLLYEGLQKVMDEMEVIKNEVIEIQIQKLGIRKFSSSAAAGGSIGGSFRGSPSSLGHTDTSMVGCDDVMIAVMDKLTRDSSSRIIPIVGMGGIGKTTLAKNIYVNPLIVQHFDLRGWATISQDYDSKEILIEILSCLKMEDSRGWLSRMKEEKLGEKLHKILYGKRYLVVMDDMWNIEAWNKVRFYFPDNDEGSRIMITTRLSDMASQLTGSCGLQMNFLDNDCSWNLFCKTLFGDDACCPPELDERGQRIAKSCKGLPLSIKVIGGLLSKHKESREYWDYVIENFNAVLNSEDDERCLKILSLSYMELPMHLKPCFLYMAAFREDGVIPKSKLIKLWVAEGFLKPISGKNMEMVAEEYLGDLLNRNLILAHKMGLTGNIKSFKIHDLLRELCIKEAQKNKFMCTRLGDPKIQQHIQSQRRVGLQNSCDIEIGPLQSSSLRTFIWDNEKVSLRLPRFNFKLLRVLMLFPGIGIPLEMKPTIWPANSRLLDLGSHLGIPHLSAYHIWNLQTLASSSRCHAQIDIWEMPQLRHIKCDYGLHLPDPTPHHEEGGDLLVVLENLQTLQTVVNFRCSEDAIKRIPNIKKLAIKIEAPHREDYSLNNLCQLLNLETLRCIRYVKPPRSTPYPHNAIHSKDLYSVYKRIRQKQKKQESINLNTAIRPSESDWGLSFPHSLKKLTLEGIEMSWEKVGTKIGLLPHLQVLKLRRCSLEREWETVEGQFRRLKYLEIEKCNDLIQWRTYRTHFPCLVKLVLLSLDNLEEIPHGIGDISTLESIEVLFCSQSVLASAKEILMRQHEIGNECFRLN